MEQLTIVGTEGQRLVLATEQGQRFTLEIDDMLNQEVRKARVVVEPRPQQVGPSPREIQAHFRAGLTAEEVAELLSYEIEKVRLFEGPVLAEREHIVDRALAMPVLTGIGVDQDENPTFGNAIRQKLADVSATQESWTSWKTDDGWVVKLTFEASGIERDARWSFDPRRSALAPANDDAAQLSRQGRMASDTLIPRLRALDVAQDEKDASSFDDHTFHEEEPAPAPEPERPTETADLLEALRRKRGQRETPPSAAEDSDEEPEDRPHRPLAMFSSIDPNLEETPPPAEETPAREEQPEEPPRATSADDDAPRADSSRRRGRPSMPSWDEIVFGARGDD